MIDKPQTERQRLAKEVGVSPSFLCMVEKGKRQVSIEKALLIEEKSAGKFKAVDLVRPSLVPVVEAFMNRMKGK